MTTTTIPGAGQPRSTIVETTTRTAHGGERERLHRLADQRRRRAASSSGRTTLFQPQR